MGIYDKRVEHVYLGANQMFDKMVRIGSNSSHTEDDAEERNKKQRGAILKMDLNSIDENEDIASYDFAKINCEEPEKISNRNDCLRKQTDPMCNKRLQAFDSNSLKSLFLNAF